MTMTLNEVLVRQSFLNQVVIKSEAGELPKDLKIKVMMMKIELNKIRNKFDEESQEMVKELKPEGFDELYLKEDKTEEETKKMEEMIQKLNEEHQTYLLEKGKESMDKEYSFTQEEFFEIININTNSVDINGTKLSAEQFLEIFNELFVE